MIKGFEDEAFDSETFGRSRLKRPLEFEGGVDSAGKSEDGVPEGQELVQLLDSFIESVTMIKNRKAQESAIENNPRLALAHVMRNGKEI